MLVARVLGLICALFYVESGGFRVCAPTHPHDAPPTLLLIFALIFRRYASKTPPVSYYRESSSSCKFSFLMDASAMTGVAQLTNSLAGLSLKAAPKPRELPELFSIRPASAPTNIAWNNLNSEALSEVALCFSFVSVTLASLVARVL